MESRPSDITISVVIPAFNSEVIIAECLTALKRQDVPRDTYEIIVVDDGSTDTTGTVAESLADAVIRTENRGSAAARNTGARAARGDILLFTDADCIPKHDWIRRMAEPFENDEIHGVKGAYLTRQTAWVARFIQAEYESKYQYMSQFAAIDFIDTYSAGFRRVTFLNLGGFDESYPGASVEDQEFSFRMAAAGFKMVFIADARVYHRHADTVTWYFRKKFNIGFWKVKVLRRHPAKTMKDSHTPQTLKLQLPLAFGIIGMMILSGVTGFLPVILLLFLFVLSGWRETAACIQRSDLPVALVSPALMFVRSLALGLGLIRGIFTRNTSVSA